MSVKYKEEGEKLIVNTEALCALLSVTRMTVKRWADEGCPKHSRGWWDLADVLKWKGMVGTGNLKSVKDSKDMSFKEKKLYYEMKYKEAQAENMYLKNSIAKGEYLKRDEVIDELNRFFVVLKRSLMGLSRKIVTDIGLIVGQTTARKIESQIKEVIEDALSQMCINGVYEPPKSKKIKG
ncbi:hypothetical protein [Romboutsia sp. 1001713B170131_170501_G6]|uniref:hypothetical protein n=1 Tax=Romboutsia sp. 1001713B170131_170501_G6 TaxID=2787108 RepID=UPI0018A9EC51|nr:hypothetical protein [Romboutsia sp. 1001713B170131_170501_G6]